MAEYPLPEQIPEDEIRSALASLRDYFYRQLGAGANSNSYQNLLTGIDRFNRKVYLPNHETAGVTFITRPELNLTNSSLRQDPVLAAMASNDKNSIPFMIRCMLDARLAKGQLPGPEKVFKQLADSSLIVNNNSPFILPLSNSIQTITGFPDLILDTSTTESGFMGEDQTKALGSDLLQKTYDISVTFREINGGIIMAILYTWVLWMILAKRGPVVAYLEDILENRLCYTCSIYRFVLDPHGTTILKYAKATGCFPVTVPIGANFNISDNEHYISAAETIQTTFKANHIEYMNGNIFKDFNTLVDRFNGGGLNLSEYTKVPPKPEFNFIGNIPYIDVKSGNNELCFYAKKTDIDALTKPVAFDNLVNKILSNGAAHDRESVLNNVSESDIGSSNPSSRAPTPVNPMRKLLYPLTEEGSEG